MSRSAKGNSSGRGESPSKGGSMLVGVVLGMILGLATAGGIAWYVLNKNPASFGNKEHRESVKPEAENKVVPSATEKSASVPPVASSGDEPKQHFEFYKVLTDKPPVMPKEARSAPVTQQPKSVPPVASVKEPYYVQAGSFPNEVDAEKLKARLALLGLEASLQMATIPNKGTYHRVRLGPFNGDAEINRILSLLKQNGVTNATTVKAQ